MFLKLAVVVTSGIFVGPQVKRKMESCELYDAITGAKRKAWDTFWGVIVDSSATTELRTSKPGMQNVHQDALFALLF